MIIVTGATGKLGSRIVERLLERVPGERIGVSVRSPERASGLEERGVRVRRGDFEDSQSLTHAFEGASQVLIVSSNARAVGGDPLAQHQRAIDAAKGAGARRILYTSHQAASHTSEFSPMLDHAGTEDLLARCGVPWTALRNGFYAGGALAMIAGALESGILAAPAEGPVSWTSHDDLAEATARILAEEGRFEGPTPPLTGAEALTLEELARRVLEARGRTLERQLLTEPEHAARLASLGVPPAVVPISLGFYRASHGGEFSAVDPCLERLIRRPPQAASECIAAAT